MIAHTELRIGNLIEYQLEDGTMERVQLTSIESPSIIRIFSVEVGSYRGSLHKAAPIHLTKKVLIELGFEFINHAVYPGWVSPEYTERQRLRIWEDETGRFWFTLNESSSIEIPYVHTLQNLFALCSGYEWELSFGTSFGDGTGLKEAIPFPSEPSPSGLLNTPGVDGLLEGI